MATTHTNQLITESSPYLLQHAHNPVNWYPWGEAAFQKAKDEDKLVLISIGYSACHWCHVMEHESFENEAVAALMNQHFVCIKVDREERPDVDQIYMEAVQLLSGRGGWPLNCFALPDGKPVWGGTYFPPKQWAELLNTLSQLYTSERSKIIAQAEQLTQGIRQHDFPDMSQLPVKTDIDNAVTKIKKTFDHQHGGLGKAPKFPMPVTLNFLHQYGFLKQDKETLNFVYLTLDKMALGGIYDQVGGGFARYSVDECWFAPHFEKMLYDNAQLISLYSDAWKATGNELYKRVVAETVNFIEHELMQPDGLFYSALDADSEGTEGKFYTWAYDEIAAIIDPYDPFFAYFDIRKEGNWENGQNILHADQSRQQFAIENNIDTETFTVSIQENLEKLRQHRNKRTRPGLDNKILASWNGLMIKGLTDAYQAFGEEKYLRMARQAMDQLLLNHISPEGQVYRIAHNGDPKIPGFLDDYASVSAALIGLYETTFQSQYLEEAYVLVEYALLHFYHEELGMVYYTPDNGEQLIARKTDLQDNVLPSSVGTLCMNLIKLSQINSNQKFEEISQLLFHKMQEQIERYPTYHAQWALMSFIQNGHQQEVAIIGPKAQAYRKILQSQFNPAVTYAGSLVANNSMDLLENRFQEDHTLIYQCRNKTCELPVNHPSKIKLIK